MGKNKNKNKNKSESSSQSSLIKPITRITEQVITQTNNKKPVLHWLLPKTPRPKPTPWSIIPDSNFSQFVNETGKQQQQQQQEIARREKITQEQERIKPLLVKYLRSSGFLDTKKYNIFPYVMGNVFGNLPDGYNGYNGYKSDMLYLCGYHYFTPFLITALPSGVGVLNEKMCNNEMEYIEIPIDIDVLNGHSDGIQIINITTPRLINKVREFQEAFNTVNKLDFSQRRGGKNNKKQQNKSRRLHASPKSYKHHRKAYSRKNVK